jgi:DNA/RNA-binding domain of Phe-tRNA-synthetase-like protein
VDAYNLASVKTGIAFAAFDEKSLKGNLLLRNAKKGEKFLGIGMRKPMSMKGRELLVSDAEKIIAVYPYRDADVTKINKKTENVLLMVCGVPGIKEDILLNAERVGIEHVIRFCGGTIC